VESIASLSFLLSPQFLRLLIPALLPPLLEPSLLLSLLEHRCSIRR
jgi:hypothetical protein